MPVVDDPMICYDGGQVDCLIVSVTGIGYRDRRKVLSFEVWEKGGMFFGKDTAKAHATWPTGSPLPRNTGDFALLRKRAEIHAALPLKVGPLDAPGEDEIGTLHVIARLWRPLEFGGLDGKGDQSTTRDVRKKVFGEAEAILLLPDDNVVDDTDDPGTVSSVPAAAGPALVRKAAARRAQPQTTPVPAPATVPQRRVAAGAAAAGSSGDAQIEQVAAKYGLQAPLLKNPLSVNAIISCDCLQKEVDSLVPQMMSINCPPAVLQRMQALNARKAKLEEAVQSGSLTVEKYVKNLDNCMTQDTKLAKALGDLGRAEEKKKVLMRLKLTKAEKAAVHQG